MTSVRHVTHVWRNGKPLFFFDTFSLLPILNFPSLLIYNCKASDKVHLDLDIVDLPSVERSRILATEKGHTMAVTLDFTT